MSFRALVAITAVLAGLVAAVAPAAHAESTTVLLGADDGGIVGGPLLFGDDLVWSARDGDRLVVRERPPGGPARTVLAVPEVQRASNQLRVNRVDGRLGVHLDVERGSTALSNRTWWADAPGAPLVEAAPCTLAVGSDYVITGHPGDVYASSPCPDDPTLAGTGDAAGTTMRLPRFGWRVAGRFAAVLGPQDQAIHVVEWRTGRPVYDIPTTTGPRNLVALDDDGTLLFQDAGGLMAATVADPTPRWTTVPVPGDMSAIVRDGRVAWSQGPMSSRGPQHGDVGVTTIATGTTVTTRLPLSLVRVPDFDGRRLAWRDGQCGLSRLVVWDVSDPPPSDPSQRCGVPVLTAPRVVTARGGAVRRAALATQVACPAASNGCTGWMYWGTQDGHSRVSLGALPFAVAPGERAMLVPDRGHRWRTPWSSRRRSVSLEVELEGRQHTRALNRRISVHR